MGIPKWITDDDGNELPFVGTLEEWATWYETHCPRRQTVFGPFLCSTVFLGLDHGIGLTARPVLWETVVLRDGSCVWMHRACTVSEAMADHQEAVIWAIMRNEEVA